MLIIDDLAGRIVHHYGADNVILQLAQSSESQSQMGFRSMNDVDSFVMINNCLMPAKATKLHRTDRSLTFTMFE
jgi:hypothetical protein